MKNAEIQGLRDEIAALREQVKGLTEALVQACASQGPVYVYYVPTSVPIPVSPWQPSWTCGPTLSA